MRDKDPFPRHGHILLWESTYPYLGAVPISLMPFQLPMNTATPLNNITHWGQAISQELGHSQECFYLYCALTLFILITVTEYSNTKNNNNYIVKK